MSQLISIKHVVSPLCDVSEESNNFTIYVTHRVRNTPIAIGVKRKLSSRSNQCFLRQLHKDFSNCDLSTIHCSAVLLAVSWSYLLLQVSLI